LPLLSEKAQVRGFLVVVLVIGIDLRQRAPLNCITMHCIDLQFFSLQA
jgi:hypothetical protein